MAQYHIYLGKKKEGAPASIDEKLEKRAPDLFGEGIAGLRFSGPETEPFSQQNAYTSQTGECGNNIFVVQPREDTQPYVMVTIDGLEEPDKTIFDEDSFTRRAYGEISRLFEVVGIVTQTQQPVDLEGKSVGKRMELAELTKYLAERATKP